MLQKFKEWLEQQDFQKRDLVVNVQDAEASPNESVFADFVSNTFYARATIWASGDFDGEAISAETEERLFFIHRELEHVGEVDEVMTEFISKLLSLREF